MHSSILIAALSATVAYATPLAARNPPAASGATYAPGPSGQPSSGSGSGSGSGGVLGNPNAQPNLPLPEGLFGELLTAPSTTARFTKLKQQLDAGAISLKFDHNPAANPNITPGEGGQVDLANQANYAFLTETDMASAVIFFDKCGLNTPHHHPRATEYFTLATASNMTFGYVLENGLTDEFTDELSIWQGAVFPQGSVHWQQNNDCKPAVGVAGLNHADPGASSAAQIFLRSTRQDVVEAAVKLPAQINGQNFEEFKDAIPAPLAKGVAECLKRCEGKY